MRICFVTASPLTVQAFLLHHIRAAASRWQAAVITNTDDPGWLQREGIQATLIPVKIERKIALISDVRALLRLWRLFRLGDFALIQSVTPKAGLLAMTAAWMAGVPVRVHTFTGQVWATRTGFARALLKLLDRVTARCASHLLADSVSQRQFLIDQGVVSPDKIAVLGDGSLAGVDCERFRANAGARRAVRARYGIPGEAVVFAMVARMNREKGVLELLEAFRRIGPRENHAWLLLIGPDEDGLASSAATGLPEEARARVVFTGYTPAPERYVAAADIYVLPSYREGFPTSVLEAAGVGLPAIASRIYGLTDAVRDGETGILVPPRDAEALATAMLELLRDPERRMHLGRAAQARAHRNFSRERLTSELMAFYAKILSLGSRSDNRARPMPRQ